MYGYGSSSAGPIAALLIILLYLAIIVAYIIIMVKLANHMRDIAYSKGYDDRWHPWAWSFWLGILGFIYVLALPDLVARKNQETMIALLGGNKAPAAGQPQNTAPQAPAKRVCPTCGKELPANAGFCSECGTKVPM